MSHCRFADKEINIWQKSNRGEVFWRKRSGAEIDKFKLYLTFSDEADRNIKPTRNAGIGAISNAQIKHKEFKVSGTLLQN